MRPNVLFITTHDTGRHLGCYGVESVQSPNLDKLAGEGIRFTQMFCASPLCSPARGALMTGRRPQSNGMMGLCHGVWDWRMNPGQKHLSHLLHEAGYHTALLGHYHETTDPQRDLCFDQQDLFMKDWKHVPGPEVARGACRFLEERAGKDQPFFLQLGFFETHRPFDFGQVEPDYEKGVHVPGYLVDDEAARADLAQFQGLIRRMDACVGEVLDKLDQLGMTENTLVVYTTDHGIAFPRAKATLHDAGIGVAFLMRWPGGAIGGGRSCDWLLSHVDVVPTLLDLLRIDAPENLEGVSFASVPASSERQGPRQEIFGEHTLHSVTGAEQRCVRTDRYKLIREFAPGREPKFPARVGETSKQETQDRSLAKLYDLHEDPLESRNLAEEPAQAEVRSRLEEKLWTWLEEVADPILQGPVVSPYYRKAIADYELWAQPSGR